ncbi:hypothetical protein SASPL_124466 [Salvia splendens]|uniref:phosphatidylinositol 3-kinase n=1 Tax=Salvia splendens TaxID=180675 RepID=A0A8X8XNA2_SALSN|nr:hypothetical protein SASPL_124466 [Salvia splendens]
MAGNEFRFFLSCDINLPVTFKIERLEGKLSARKPPDSASVFVFELMIAPQRRRNLSCNLYVESLLYIDGAPFGLPMRTRLEPGGPSYCWNELITLSTKYRDLMANSQLAVTVYDVSCGKDEELVGGATIHLFNMKKQLKTGKHKLDYGRAKKQMALSIQTHQESFERRVESGANFIIPSPIASTNELVTVWDPEVGKINPSEHKQLKLARSLNRGIIDRDLKPSITERKALTKFLRCVEWSDVQEAKQALELMGKWETVDVCDALELLSPVFESEEVRAYAVSVLERADDEELQCYLLQLVQALRFERSDKSRLSYFLVERSLCNTDLASFLRWYVAVELHDHPYARRFYSTYELLEESMLKLRPSANSDEDGFKLWQSLVRQTELTVQLCSITRDVRNVRGGTQKKIEKLRQLLSGLLSELTYFDENSESPIFKSALHPLRLAFRTASGGSCKIIFKKGDDLRQDQLVIQMVSLMDRLLKLENLDLHLTPYRVLATGHILSEHRSITSYLQKFYPDEDGPFGITATCLETFIKSCAGYSVITYILGIGDRHLENLLLQDDGRLFHVDFGFILGRDPKPFPPPMKLCKEMVEAMGGAERLILNLFHLMAGSNIPDIASDPEKGILKLQEKFRLDLDNEESIHFFQDLINESVSALFPQMVETIHRWAQYWR